MVSGISLEDRYTVPGRHWHPLDDGRVQCDVCPRACRLHEGQRGLCFVRARVADLEGFVGDNGAQTRQVAPDSCWWAA